MIYPQSFDEKTGFAAVREMVAGLCISSLGREHVSAMKFLTGFEDIDLRLNQTEEFRHILLFADNFPLGNIGDVTPGLKKLRVEGTFMEAVELFELKRSLDTARGLINWFSGKNAESYPALTALAAMAAVPAFVRERLGALLTKEGRIKDNASPELLSIRRGIADKQASVSKRIQAIMKKAQGEGLAEPDAGVAVRDGRLVIPVNASVKRKIKGFIHDESASGKTAYIEPAEVVELNNEIRELEYAERREVHRILKEFADALRPYVDELLEVFRYLGLVDFIRAKAMFAKKVGGVKPVLSEGTVLSWKQALHPLLWLTLSREKRETVPLDIELDGENRILVISGPNAGGKSVCLQTVGLLQYMLQCGMLVPMSENSEAGIFEGIFIDIGDEQSIENDLSTYSSHLLNMKHFIRESGTRTLIMIDEFGAGTEPMIGGAIAEAILDELNRRGTWGVITTHYTNLKHFAASTPGIMNGAMMFDTGAMEPLFRLETGKPGSSFAFEIARKTGIPEEILKAASDRVGEDHINFDRHLKDIIRDKHYWDRKRKSIRQLEKKLEKDLERYEEQLGAARSERKEIVAKAKEEARTLLDTVNKQIENTIREIREAQAEKERTKAAREKVEELKGSVKDATGDISDDTVERKMEKIRAKKERIRKRKEREAGSLDAGGPGGKGDQSDSRGPGARAGAGGTGGKGGRGGEEDDRVIRAGDYVRLTGRDITGEVLEAGGKSVMVAFGNMITTVKESRLEKLSRGEARKLQKGGGSAGSSAGSSGGGAGGGRAGDTGSGAGSGMAGGTGGGSGSGVSGSTVQRIRDKKLSFKPERDVRGMRADEALDVVSRLIDDALMVGAAEVKILHGKGNGILRQIIRDYLATVPPVRSFRDEDIRFGGTGITLVELEG
ncbi:MAG: endonuclease MutS2 [Marinilabiliales bacterium]|nr:MAG: endonuclease MutS2 [Marinilabiliales bacterium]